MFKALSNRKNDIEKEERNEQLMELFDARLREKQAEREELEANQSSSMDEEELKNVCDLSDHLSRLSKEEKQEFKGELRLSRIVKNEELN